MRRALNPLIKEPPYFVVGGEPFCVGVFFSDADHSTEATRAALDAVRPLLASPALIVVDDAEWPRVRAATDAFLDANPQAELRLRIAGRADGRPWWWDGMDLVAWTAYA